MPCLLLTLRLFTETPPQLVGEESLSPVAQLLIFGDEMFSS